MGSRIGLLVDDMFVNQDSIDSIPLEEKDTVKEFCSKVLEELSSGEDEADYWCFDHFDDITGPDRSFSG